MMDPKDILAIQMALKYGSGGKQLLKAAVNAALDYGEWHDDFDIAVTGPDLDDEEARQLLAAVLDAYPEWVLDVSNLNAVIDRHLPQAALTDIAWIIGPDYALVLTDSLRVAKVQAGCLSWVTNRISWDGIVLERIEDDVVFGSWYDAMRTNTEWQPFQLSYTDGRLLHGEVIEF
jgi:hypothetical protein